MRSVIVILLLLCSMAGIAGPKPLPKAPAMISTPDGKLVKYDSELYQLAFDIFMANSNQRDALLVAKAAVMQRPRQLDWRMRYAAALHQDQQLAPALEQYQWVAMRSVNPRALQQALHIARALNDHERVRELLLRRLQIEPGHNNTRMQLADTEIHLGRPEAAADLLREELKLHPDASVMQRLGLLYQQLGEERSLTEVLANTQPGHPKLSKIRFNHAKRLVQLGELEGAFSLLHRHPELAKVDPGYWKLLADLAWLLDKHKHAEKAYKQLYRRGRLDESATWHLLDLTRDKDKPLAYQLSQQGFAKYNNPAFFQGVLSYGIATGDYQNLHYQLANLTAAQRQQLQRQAFFYMDAARVYQQLGDTQKAGELYASGLKAHPDNALMRVNYFWYLMDTQQTTELLRALNQWQNAASTQADLWPVYAQGLTLIGRKDLALHFYQRLLATHQRSWPWLLKMSVVLNEAGYPVQSFSLRDFARRWMKQPLAIDSIDAYQGALGQALMFMPNEVAINWLHYGEPTYSPAVIEGSYAFALAGQHYDYAGAVEQRTGRDKMPVWAAQTLALHRQDLPRLQHLLAKHIGSLPHRDRVAALIKTRQIASARYYAYKGLAEHPNDDKAYDWMRVLMDEYSNTVEMSTEYKTLGILKGTVSHMAARYFITQRLALMPQIDIWNIARPDLPDLRILPQHIRQERLGIRLLQKRGPLDVSVTQYHLAQDFLGVSINKQYRYSNRLNLEFEGHVNRKNLYTEALYLYGLEDTGQINANYQATAHSIVIGQVWAGVLRSQQRQKLANHYGGYLEWDTNGWDPLPRAQLGPFISAQYFNPAHELPAQMQSLFNTGVIPSIGFFVPPSAKQYGVRIHMNDFYQNNYAHRVIPFFDASIFNNTVTGKGYNITLGIAGKLFGRDHLSLYWNQNENSGEFNAKAETLALSYKMYFS